MRCASNQSKVFRLRQRLFPNAPSDPGAIEAPLTHLSAGLQPKTSHSIWITGLTEGMAESGAAPGSPQQRAHIPEDQAKGHLSENSSPRHSSRGRSPLPTFLEKVQRCVWPKERAETRSSPRKEIPVTQWIIRRVQRMCFFPKKKDPEFEDIELAPLRYRPSSINQLIEATRFTKEELQFMYRGFKQECPTGVISEETFKTIYGKFFPICGQLEDGSGRNTAMYAHYVFGTMDQEGTGHITFGDFIMGLSVLLKGSLQERINWAFNLYDINNDGYITREELIDIVSSVYDLMGDETHPNIDDATAVDHVDRLFKRLDLNKDGVVTIDEFMEYCSKNESIISSMNIFDSI